MKKIFCQIEKCLACGSCELACAVAHSESKTLVGAIQEASPPKSRIQVFAIEAQGAPDRVRAIALQCRHCGEPLCVQGCISGGITKDEQTGDIVMDKEKCVACWSCIMVCPYGVIVRDENNHCVLKCDHCQDQETPSCVKACPSGALVYSDDDQEKKSSG